MPEAYVNGLSPSRPRRYYDDSMTEHVDVLVIGAGLAGLNAALTMSAAGKQVLVLEASDGIGGRVRTDEVDGLQLDRGFQILNPVYPEVQRLGVADELDLRPFDAGVMISLEQGISKLGDPRRLPQWLMSGITSEIGDVKSKARLVAALGKAWLRGSMELPSSRAGSVADALMLDGVGPHVYERALKPFLTGVFLDDPANVAAGYGDFVLRSFIEGAPALPARGMGALPRAMALRLPSEAIATGVRVHTVQQGRVETSEGGFTADRIIVAVDPQQARHWFPHMDVPETRSCTTWYHVVDVSPTDARAILVDGLARGPVINSVAISKVAQGYASRGRTLISSTALGCLPTYDDESAARKHLAAMWGVPTGSWECVRTDVIEHALPNMAVNAPMSRSIDAGDGVYLAGDHRETPSQQGALLSGRRAAEAALRSMR